MRQLLTTLLIFVMLTSISSCGFMHKIQNLFKPKYGCPSNGRNIGAEKIISGDPQAMKDLKKAKKFKS